MNDFRLDPDLHDTLRAVRQSVRALFEELRLTSETADVSGKERLERVPALAKRNFRNLHSSSTPLARKQAWRLVDFLDGAERAGLSPHARDGLRAVVLDQRLEALRSSPEWRQAAVGLKDALGARLGESDGAAQADASAQPPPGVAPSDGAVEEIAAAQADGSAPSPAGAPPSDGAVEEVSAGAGAAAGTRRWRPIFSVGWRGWLGAAALAGAVVLAEGRWRQGPAPEPGDCLALERAPPQLIARHREVRPLAPPPRPPQSGERRIFTISDPPAGGPVLSTWTTSQYSFAQRTAPTTPGGGKLDVRLRVGGWGDTYVSLVKVPVPSDRLAHSAVLELTVIGDTPDSRPTPMALRAVGDEWSVSSGSNNRLWWKDCPASQALVNHLPAPGPRGSAYDMDITDLYNTWAAGLFPNNGIMLEPEHIGSWQPGRPRYGNFSTFYSTRARDPANRPRLILTY